MKKIIWPLLLALSLVACSGTKETTLTYDEVKKIVIDSLQTEDGKKAMRQLLEEPAMRDLIVLEHDEVNTAIKDTLLSDESAEFWKKTFEDPKFQETIAKSMQKEQEEILKKLIKDSSVQEDLTAFFAQPDMQKQLGTILKGAKMRKEIETIVQETIESPLLEKKWQDLVKESGGSQEKKGTEEKSGGGDSGGKSGDEAKKDSGG